MKSPLTISVVENDIEASRHRDNELMQLPVRMRTAV
jgi:hypothetical protein